MGGSVINNKTRANAAKAPKAKAAGRKVRRTSSANTTVKALLRGFYWMLMIGVGGLVLFVLFELYKAFDETRRAQQTGYIQPVEQQQSVASYRHPHLNIKTNRVG